jgi:hypothetical protein
VEGSCELGNEPSGSIKCVEILTTSQEGLTSLQVECLEWEEGAQAVPVRPYDKVRWSALKTASVV